MDRFAARRFEELLGGPEEDVVLDEAMLLVAAHATPTLDIGAQLARLDALAAGCPEPTLAGVRHHLFEVIGFDGDRRRYDDPRNSYLDVVLDRRTGIPISLSVLTIEVGRRLGVPLAGVALPGHFLVRHLGSPPSFVDAFHGGRLLDGDGARALYHSLFGTRARFDPTMLAPVGPRVILARVLANLRALAQASGDVRLLGWALRLRAAIPATTVGEGEDLATVQASLGRYDEAAGTLEALAPQLAGRRAARAVAAAARLRARLN